jgi:hypothetical protein
LTASLWKNEVTSTGGSNLFSAASRSFLIYKVKETFLSDNTNGEEGMESLESRMERLTPEQRREVEDFVDFLLLKNNFSQNPPAVSSPYPVQVHAPPVLTPEPVPAVLALRMQDLVICDEPHLPAVCPDPESCGIHEIANTDEDGYMDYGKFEQAATPASETIKGPKRKIIARDNDKKSGHLLDWVD